MGNLLQAIVVVVFATGTCIGLFFLLPELLLRLLSPLPAWAVIRRSLIWGSAILSVLPLTILLFSLDLSFAAHALMAIVLMVLALRPGPSEGRRKMADLLQETSLALKHRLPL